MFTGIIEEIGIIDEIKNNKDIVYVKILCNKVLNDLHKGESICVSGICLTVVEKGKNFFSVEIVPETIDKSNSKNWRKNSLINLERSLKLTDRINGHIVQGHVDNVCIVKNVNIIKDSWEVNFILNKKLKKYIVLKGSITLNGVSLTVSNIKKDFFSVSLIPETLKRTNLNKLKPGDFVNIEVDIFAKYVENLIRK